MGLRNHQQASNREADRNAVHCFCCYFALCSSQELFMRKVCALQVALCVSNIT
jgi:hypothetical protein